MKTFATLILLSSLPFALPAAAQVRAPSDADARNETTRTESVVGSGGPIDRATGGTAFSAFEFSNENGETEAKLALTFRLNRIKPDESSDGTYSVVSSKLTVSGQTPLDGEGGFSQIFKGDSLVSGSKLKANYTFFKTTLKDGTNVDAIETATLKECVLVASRNWAAEGANSEHRQGVESILSQFVLNLQTPNNTPAISFRQIGGKPDGLTAIVNDECINANVVDVVGEYNPDQLDAFRGGYFTRKPAFFGGFDASIGADSYNSLDRPSFEIDKVDRKSWEVGGYAGLIGDDLNWSVRARGVYGKTYVAPDEAQICRTVTGASDPECIKGPDGLPKRQYTGVISVEGRKLFTLEGIAGTNKIGFAPQVSYRFEDDDLNVELPIYLSPDKDGKLSGGLKFAYSSKEDDFGIGLFVGVPFSVFFE